jgi:DNA-binding transcriptional LysR family regulator
VAETGSFVAAAERLHTVQSNVTAHIKKLEEELEAQLFHRIGAARLTTAGLALWEYAERILDAHDEALTLFKSDDTASGRLCIGAMETTMALRLPPILAAFHAAHPDAEIQLKTGPTAELIEWLMAGKVDCAFIAGPLEHHRYHQFKAFNEQLVLVSSEPISVMPPSEALLTATFLAFRQGCSYRQRIELLLASHGINAARIIEFGSLDAMLGCVSARMGYAVLPRGVFEAHQHRFGIHSLALPHPIAEVDTYFVTAEQNTWAPSLARFVDTLRQSVVKGEPEPLYELS